MSRKLYIFSVGSEEDRGFINAEVKLLTNNTWVFDRYKSGKGKIQCTHFHAVRTEEFERPLAIQNLQPDDEIDLVVFGHGDYAGGRGGDPWVCGLDISIFLKVLNQLICKLNIQEQLQTVLMMVCGMGQEISLAKFRQHVGVLGSEFKLCLSKGYCFLDDYGRPRVGCGRSFEEINGALKRRLHNYKKLCQHNPMIFKENYAEDWVCFDVGPSKFDMVGPSYVRGFLDSGFGTDNEQMEFWQSIEEYEDYCRTCSEKQIAALKTLLELTWKG